MTELPRDEKRKIGNESTNMISTWAADAFGKEREWQVTNYVRALARHATHPDENFPRRLCQSREEAQAIKEAAQDIMEIVNSIIYKTRHGEEKA